MAQYTCLCGHHWSDITDEFDGYITWLDNGPGQKAIVKALWSFARACREGTRTAWLGSYFGKTYPQDQENDAIAEDIFHREAEASRTGIFRCPECRRIMVYEDDGRWHGYAPDPDLPGE